MMKKTGLKRHTRRNMDIWAGLMIHQTAKGDVDCTVFGKRLNSVVDDLFPPEAIQPLDLEVLKGLSEPEAATRVTRTLSRQFTTPKILEYVQIAQETLDSHPDNSCTTIGEFMKYWADSTEQDLSDLEDRVYPRLEVLVESWQHSTGNLSLTNSEIMKYPLEAAEFWAAFLRILVKATPATSLTKSILRYIPYVNKSASFGVDSKFKKQLEKACCYKARKMHDKTSIALKDNTTARAAFTGTEVAALVEYHLSEQAWGGDTGKAVGLLRSCLQYDLKGYLRDKSIKLALTNALRLISRRSLLCNLSDAVKGKLRVELVSKTLEWFTRVKVQVESVWEYSPKPLLRGDTEDIRQWLFRR